MDKNIEIQLGVDKNANSISVDTYDKIQLLNNSNRLLEYDIRNILSVTEVFQAERQGTEIYRIYGGIEWLSLLNGMNKDYKYRWDFFKPYYCEAGNCTFKDIYSSFKFYLVRPTTGYTDIRFRTTEYVRYFEVMATPEDFELFNAGYSTNLFQNEKQGFVFNKDFDISSIVDDFGMPLDELYLYAEYVPDDNGFGTIETMQRINWSTTHGSASKVSFTPVTLNIGDRVYGDKVNYYESNFLQTIDEEQIYYIACDLWDNASRRLRFKYNPFTPLKLRYFSNELSRANTGGTIYEQTTNIPYYATDMGDGNMIWRNILAQGYIDPLTGNGVDYPFVNKRRYLFENVIIAMIPDLDDSYTADVFSEIKFDDPTSLNYSPLGDVNDIGKPCQ